MQPSNPDKPEPTPEGRLRTMRIIWAVFLLAVGLYALVGYVAGPMTSGESGAATGELGRQLPPGRGASPGPPALLLPLLVIVGVVAVLSSIVVRRAFVHRAAEGRRPALLQTGMVVAVALCEAAALCGLVGLFVTGDSYSYVLFAAGAAGIALHYPRRGEMLAASHGTFGRTGAGGFGR